MEYKRYGVVGHCIECGNWRRVYECQLDTLETRLLCEECIKRLIVSQTLRIEYQPPESALKN